MPRVRRGDITIAVVTLAIVLTGLYFYMDNPFRSSTLPTVECKAVGDNYYWCEEANRYMRVVDY